MLSIASTVPVVKGGYFVPRYNVKITDYKIIYELGLPGFKRDDVQVSVSSGILNISSQSRKEYVGYVSCPVRVAPFSVSFTIPSHSEVESASMREGLLTVAVRTQSVKGVAVT
jgi:HSP20 family molecular chaperone IbpA